MNNIKAAINLNNTWTITEELPSTHTIDLEFVIASSSFEAMADQFKFGFEILDKDNCVVYQGAFPSINSYYKQISAGTLETVRLSVLPDSEYIISVWALNGTKMFQESLNVKTVKSEKPFLSWVWENNTWAPPTPYPTDGKYYVWNEATTSWEEIT
jgi:hypothetical protein